MTDLDARVAALMKHADAITDLYKPASPIKPLGLAFRRANLENAIRAELRAIQLELSGHTEESWTDAAIRASKGEKT